MTTRSTCSIHPGAEAVTCATCARPLCSACSDTCATCAPVAATLHDHPRRSVRQPWIAWILTVVPGLGLVYVGLPERGLMQFATWLGGVFLLGMDLGGFVFAMLLLAWLGFWFWCGVDAISAARAVNRAGRPLTQDEAASFGHGPLFGMRADTRGFGIALCALGALLLLQQFAGVVAAWMRFLVPLGLVGCGLWVLSRARRAESRDTDTIDIEPEPNA